MIIFPNAKINLGLNIINKREDGYHNLETIFYPVPLCDIMEIIPADKTVLHVSGNKIDCAPEKNLVIKAYEKLKKEFDIPSLDIYLHKIIPDGAGLGGGSADASFMLKAINDLFNLNISNDRLIHISKTLGADCPFFIYNKPMLASGIGEILTPVDLSLKGKGILIIKPNVYVSTKIAFSNIKLGKPECSVKDIIGLPIEQWKNLLKNDFETSVFSEFPQLREIKEELYINHAMYASMSGSGSALYGIFESVNMAEIAKNAINCHSSFIFELQ